jgi:uracil-DNA glycosylase
MPHTARPARNDGGVRVRQGRGAGRNRRLTSKRPAGPPEPNDASPFVPASRDLGKLKDAARGCHGCPLYRHATQTVFGEGPASSSVVLVGEQPGDQEDRKGLPFVGPAGRLLDEALRAAGLSREKVYVTNVVKHFKYEQRGKRRIHKKPNASEIAACRPWLEAELRATRPRVLVALGVTAAQSMTRRDAERRASGADGPPLMVTIHPSAALRAPDSASRSRLRARLIRDLEKARRAARR